MMNEIYEILADIRPEFDFKESSDFVEDGYLDSFDIVTLVSELDTKYNISIDGLDIVAKNFCSIEAIMNIIRKNGGEI
ncbi:MAG TPA: acyl carrier protein [Lachnospiraceae bacterium]|nr:acyl carrier protein [Lachnospiraceae bacterium]